MVLVESSIFTKYVNEMSDLSASEKKALSQMVERWAL